MRPTHTVIIGNGIAGITLARHLRKKTNNRITVISGETEYFFSRTALMYVYMGHMKFEHTQPYEPHFWRKNKIELIKDWVKKIDFEKKNLALTGSNISYDQLVLATGSQHNLLGCSDESLQGVQGLFNYSDLKLMEENTKSGVKNAVVVGGGLIGIEMAEMLHSRGIHVTYLIRENYFWGNVLPKEESSIVNEIILENGIELRKKTELEEILDDGTGKVKGIRTKTGEVIDCQFVGLAVGVHPNIDLIKGTVINYDRGILVDEYLQTSLPDVYAIGDCTQLIQPSPNRRSIEAVWYVGRMMGETLANTLAGNRTKYDPGIWFNSAKFFDVEYQTYGTVSSKLCKDCHHFYWQTEDRRKCIKIIFNKSSSIVLGVNIFGMRYRHEVWNRWLTEQKTMDYVMQHIREANFDPEFFKKWEDEILKQYYTSLTSSQWICSKKI